MATNIEITSSEKTYNLYVWVKETGMDQSTLINGTIAGKISVTGERKKLNTLTGNILGENKWIIIILL